MQLDSGSKPRTGKEAEDTMDDLQESTLNWLLDKDLSEPEESLFSVDLEGDIETDLSDYELEVARRPMTRGDAGADDLANYVSEEIVISSDSDGGGDIYSRDSLDVSPERGAGDLVRDENMAVDYSRTARDTLRGTTISVTDGSDILGLADDDDMGEKFMAVKRVTATTASKPDGQQDASRRPPTLQTTSASEQPPESELTEPGLPELVLSEAPSLRLVSTAESLAVANDTLAFGVDEANADSELADDSPGTDQQGQVAQGDSAELAMLPLDSPSYFDTDPAEPIDYHEDFRELEGFGSDTVANVTPLIPQLIEEMLAAVNERAAELGLAVASVQAELMLGCDDSTVEQLCSDGFEPVITICNPPLASLRQLGQVDVEAIFIRLTDAQTGQSCNRIFEEDFTLATTEDVSQAATTAPVEIEAGGEGLDTLFAQSQAMADAEPAAELPDNSLEDSREEAAETLIAQSQSLAAPAPAGTLIEQGQALSLSEQPSGLNPAAEELPVADSEMQLPAQSTGFDDLEFDSPVTESTDETVAVNWQPDDQDIDDVFADFGQADADAAADELLSCAEPQQETTEPETEDSDVFATDTVSADTNAEVPDLEITGEADIEACFDSLDDETDDFEDVIGVAEEELAVIADEQPEALVDQAEEDPVPQEAVAEPAYELSCIPTDINFAQASPGGGEIFSDFLDAFIEEGSSEIEKLEDAVAAWEREVTCEDAYTAVTRILHTIKGIAKGVGLQFYGTLVHNFETLLGGVPRPQNGAELDYFRVVNTWLDACVRGLDHIQDQQSDITNVLPQVAGEPLSDMPADIAVPSVDASCAVPAQLTVEPAGRDQSPEPEPAPVAAATAATVREQQLSKKIADDGARVLAAQQSVRITSEKLDDLLNMSNQAQQLSVRTAQSVTRGKRASTEMQSRLASVRSHIAGIADRALRSVAAGGSQAGGPMDALEMDQYSELQEAANILREGVEDLADLVDFATRQNTQIEALLKQQTNVISSIGSAIRGARVVPVSRLIPGLRRLVRTVSVDLNKTVAFRVLNELGTLDRDDYARCQTILDHMMRNALDHGIESSEQRLAAGKPAEGKVTIDIRKAGADTIITLADDGRGIDPARMRESARRKGLDVDVDALTDDEAVRLVFHKGFSTAGTISQISGRGVGMDIVLSELQEMGGDIQIESVTGRGTSFQIRVPSSITVNGALLVSAGEQSYAIPLGGLICVEQVPVDDFFAAVRDKTLLSLAGLECEPAYLATLCHTGHSLDAKTWRNNVPVIVAGSAERYMAIAVDDVEEALELVIRSLGSQFSTVPGVAGAATTAAGEAIVALDLNLLVDSVGLEDQSTFEVDAGRDESPLVMVVDDSRTQRMVATSQLETLGVETITAENGAVALDLLNAADRLPDIILMDVEMPVKDGIQALRDIRKSVRFPEIPVIMITSRTGLKHRAMAQAAGCNGYMGKPFNFRMLVGQINELTGHQLQLT